MPNRQVVIANRSLTIQGLTVYRNMVNVEANLLDEIRRSDKWQQAKVVTPDGEAINEIRTNDLIVFRSDSSLFSFFDDIFQLCLTDFLCRNGAELVSKITTGYQVLRYENGGKYDTHMDDGVKTPRRVSALLYLNDDYDGGQLEFPLLGIFYKPMAGDLVMFPSGMPYAHAALPVTSGIKYCVVAWWL